MRYVKTCILVLMLLILGGRSSLRAQSGIPPMITFQGFLADDAGQPITDTLSVLFKLYDDAVTSTSLWMETQDVGIIDGIFDVYLGETTPIPDSVFDRTEVYLGIKVGSDEEMTPRQRLAATAWSYASACVFTVWYEDTDGDGYGVNASTTIACHKPSGFAANNTDCNDSSSSIHPDALEFCNGLDDDCSGVIDDGTAGSECDDFNQCTSNGCDNGACFFTDLPQGVGCNDSDACTTSDVCDGSGGCAGTPIDCDDSNECTTDSCSGGGCTHTFVPNDVPCSGGTCQDGICVAS